MCDCDDEDREINSVSDLRKIKVKEFRSILSEAMRLQYDKEILSITLMNSHGLSYEMTWIYSIADNGMITFIANRNNSKCKVTLFLGDIESISTPIEY